MKERVGLRHIVLFFFLFFLLGCETHHAWSWIVACLVMTYDF
jgi:hypothetical protein